MSREQRRETYSNSHSGSCTERPLCGCNSRLQIPHAGLHAAQRLSASQRLAAELLFSVSHCHLPHRNSAGSCRASHWPWLLSTPFAGFCNRPFCFPVSWHSLAAGCRLQSYLLAPAYASDNGWHNQPPLPTALSCSALCRQPIAKPEGWLLWAVLGVVLAPVVVGLTVTAVSATGYDVSGVIAYSLVI